MLYGWKENSMVTNCLAACAHLSSTVSQLFELQVQKIAVFTYRSPHFCFPWGRPWGNHANSMLTNCLAACAHLTITVSEIERDICRKSSIFHTPLHSTPPLFPVGISPPRLEKLEWLGYPMVKKFRRYLYSFWRNSRTWRTHRQTDVGYTGWRHIPRLCICIAR